MKKVLVTIAFFSLLFACNQRGAESVERETTTTENTVPAATEPAPTASLSDNPDYVKGMELEAKSDCNTCHKIDEKLIGPSFREIAAKYPMNDAVIDSLSEKVIKGGAGNWGQVPMTPHPNLSKEDAKAIVKYVLLLKK